MGPENRTMKIWLCQLSSATVESPQRVSLDDSAIQNGAPSLIRTDHLLFTKQLLYRMSYRGENLITAPLPAVILGFRTPE